MRRQEDAPYGCVNSNECGELTGRKLASANLRIAALATSLVDPGCVKSRSML
jgi:hypothetical protein